MSKISNVAVLGHDQDYHAVHILNALKARGHNAFLLDTAAFSRQFKMSWMPQMEQGSIAANDGSVLQFDNIDAVYWRSIDSAKIPELENTPEHDIAQMDSFSLLKTLLYERNINWVNSLDAYQFHRVKPRQLALASVLGARIPKTIISNNANDIIEFSRHIDKAIFKPVQGGASTEFLTEELLQEDRLKFALSYSPVTIQEYIPGTNVRTYVMGDKIFNAEINSDAVDFRTDVDSELRVTELPEPLQELSKKVCQRFGMQWTAIDWRRTPDNEYYFLEANPSPMFFYFEQQTGHPITEELVNLLVA